MCAYNTLTDIIQYFAPQSDRQCEPNFVQRKITHPNNVHSEG